MISPTCLLAAALEISNQIYHQSVKDIRSKERDAGAFANQKTLNRARKDEVHDRPSHFGPEEDCLLAFGGL